MKLTLTKVVRKDTDKLGKPLVTADGRAYTRLGLQCAEYGTKWLSGFAAPWNADWKEGSVVEADVETKGEYLNVKRPDPVAEMSRLITKAFAEITLLRNRVEVLEKAVHRTTPAQQYEPPMNFDPSGAPIEEEEPQALNDLPF